MFWNVFLMKLSINFCDSFQGSVLNLLYSHSGLWSGLLDNFFSFLCWNSASWYVFGRFGFFCTITVATAATTIAPRILEFKSFRVSLDWHFRPGELTYKRNIQRWLPTHFFGPSKFSFCHNFSTIQYVFSFINHFLELRFLPLNFHQNCLILTVVSCFLGVTLLIKPSSLCIRNISWNWPPLYLTCLP